MRVVRTYGVLPEMSENCVMISLTNDRICQHVGYEFLSLVQCFNKSIKASATVKISSYWPWDLEFDNPC